jgi:hypothetical protein
MPEAKHASDREAWEWDVLNNNRWEWHHLRLSSSFFS